MLARYAHLSPTHLWSAVEGLTVFKSQISDGTVTKTVTNQSDEKKEGVQPIDITGEPWRVHTEKA